MDEKYKDIQKKIFDILYDYGGKFFDMGLPLTETMLLTTKFAYKDEVEIVPTLAKANFKRIAIGVESFDQNIRQV